MGPYQSQLPPAQGGRANSGSAPLPHCQSLQGENCLFIYSSLAFVNMLHCKLYRLEPRRSALGSVLAWPEGAVASPYKASLAVSPRSPWPDDLCACRMHRLDETGMSQGMHTNPCSTRNRCVPASLASRSVCPLPVTRKTTAGAAVAV